MFEGQRSAASIGIKSRNERVGSMPKPAYAIQTIAKGAGITLSRRACRRSSDEHRRREGYGRRRRNVARAAGSDFQCGRGEQPVTANRTGTDFTQENLGVGYPRRAYLFHERNAGARAPARFCCKTEKGAAARICRSVLCFKAEKDAAARIAAAS